MKNVPSLHLANTVMATTHHSLAPQSRWAHRQTLLNSQFVEYSAGAAADTLPGRPLAFSHKNIVVV
jgi:hypothetical protein